MLCEAALTCVVYDTLTSSAYLTSLLPGVVVLGPTPGIPFLETWQPGQAWQVIRQI